MWKFAIAFLRNPNRSLQRHAFFKRDPSPSLLLNTLAPGESRCEEVSSGEVGAWKSPEISMEPLETSKARKLKADNTDCGSLHARPKATGKSKRKAKASAKQDLGHIAFKAENVEHETAAQNATTEQAEEVASLAHSKAHKSIMNARTEVSECLAKLDLKSYKHSRRWEETAYMMLDYGISSAHVTKMLPKCTAFHCGRSPDSTLKNFTMLGMSHEEIGRVISQWPGILAVSPNAFQCKVEFFESMGIDRLSLGKYLHRAVQAMTRSVRTLRARRDFWKDYFQDVHVNALHTLVLNNPGILTLDLERTVAKIAYLEEQGFSKKSLLKKSAILGSSLEEIARKISLLEQFGLSNARSRVMAFTEVHRISIPRLYARFHNLLALGFCTDQLPKIILGSPSVLKYSEDRINLRLSYAVNVMNLSLDTLAACPLFWGHSFEKRIKYRNEVIQELIALGAYEKNIGLSYMMSMSNTDFSRKFVERLEAYTKHSNI